MSDHPRIDVTADARWLPVDDLLAGGELAFDHAAIVRDALESR